MKRSPILILVATLAVVTMACGITINLPKEELMTTEMQTEDISIPKPDSSSINLTLAFGAGELSLSSGNENALVSGTATYNVKDLKPEIDVNGGDVRLSTGNLEIKGIPRIRGDFKNIWDLQLSSTPMNLKINAGAYQGRFELGGLALQTLDISDGASDVQLNFSEPNMVEMDNLRYTTGASQIDLRGLGNANFTTMNFRSGAGNYSLDFSGQLNRNATVNIESGISQVIITVPEGTNTKLNFKGGLSNVDTSGGWEKSGDQYQIIGNGPTLTIFVDMGAGNLELRTNQ